MPVNNISTKTDQHQRIALHILLLLTLLLIASSISAQFEPAFEGPIIATTPAQQDRILLYDMETNEHRTLSFGPGEHHVWGFSPDGCRILFTIDAHYAGFPQLYSADLHGNDQQALIQYDGENTYPRWGAWEPQWSSNGRIAFTMIRDARQANGNFERETHIAWIDGAGGEPTFYSVTGREYTPQWSPDGDWLAYVSYSERVAGENVFSTAVPTVEPAQNEQELPMVDEADLWVVHVDGETKYPLTTFSVGSMSAPRWSPDGELVGFVFSISNGNDTFWMVANSEGAISTQLSTIYALALDHTWLPDSTAMLASIRDFQDIEDNYLWKIPLVGNADTAGAFYLTDSTDYTYTDFPRFSADGRYLAFRNAYSLMILDAELQTPIVRLYDEQPGNTPPVWSPIGFTGESSCAG